jgi:phthalate 4,5-dioxygenase oxygenase subunit
MLTHEENDLLCRVEGNAPMGQIMRRHWMPACLSEELPEPDGTPVAVRLLGEDLVAWRNTEGHVGLMDRHCTHRRASLVLARNEEDGLRCLYHGWKFNIEGKVVDMPSEPAQSALAQKLKIKVYPTHEYAGIVWTYMGPAESMPPFEPPAFAPTPDTKVSIVKIQVDCNWAQILEGNIDSAHSSSLHSSNIVPAVVPGTQYNGLINSRPTTDKAPRIQVHATDYGFKYAAIRRPIKNAETLDYVRMTLFVAPFTALVPPNAQYSPANVNVPMDDTHTMFYFIVWADWPNGGVDQEAYRKRSYAQVGIHLDRHYRKAGTPENNYLQDRQAMKNGDFTGLRGVPNQDIPMWETMGPIADRSQEVLGASDIAIAEFRRVMVDAARRFQAGGPAIGTREWANQLGVAYTRHAELRSFEGMLPKGMPWRDLDKTAAQRARDPANAPQMATEN